MKQLLILIILLIDTAIVFAQLVNDDMNFFNYRYDKALIKSKKIETVTIEMSFADGNTLSKTVFKFDDDGLLKSESIFDLTNKLKREFYFVTNSHNDLISRIQKDYEYNRVDTVRFYKLYADNRLVKDSSSEMPISYTYQYGSNGNLKKTIVFSNFGVGNRIKRVILNTFDSLSRIINSVETVFQNDSDITGVVFSDRDFIYDNEGKLQREVEKLNSKYSWIANKGSINYVYDGNGNLTQLLRENAASYFYTYDKNGLITTRKMDMKLDADDFDPSDKKIEAFDKFTYTFKK